MCKPMWVSVTWNTDSITPPCQHNIFPSQCCCVQKCSLHMLSASIPASQVLTRYSAARSIANTLHHPLSVREMETVSLPVFPHSLTPHGRHSCTSVPRGPHSTKVQRFYPQQSMLAATTYTTSSSVKPHSSPPSNTTAHLLVQLPTSLHCNVTSSLPIPLPAPAT